MKKAQKIQRQRRRRYLRLPVLHILRVMNLCMIFCINGRVRIQTGLLLMVHGSYPQMAILWNMMQRQSVTVQQVQQHLMRLPKIPEIWILDTHMTKWTPRIILLPIHRKKMWTRQILSRQMELIFMQWTAKEIFVLLRLLP